jgi:hypothetical protein
MNLNRILQAVASQKIHGAASAVFPCASAEFYVEMLSLSEYERLMSAEGVHSVSCSFIADDIVHEVRFKIRSDDFQFDLSF